MPSPAQVAANRLNSQKSTGPRTDTGRAKSATNSFRHGLYSSQPTFVDAKEQSEFEALREKLDAACLPAGDVEEQAFLRYAFSTFQVQRAQRIEAAIQDRWIDSPDNPNLFLEMERFIKITTLLERRADKALNELRRLQKDRLCTTDIHSELWILGMQSDIPVTLPSVELRKTTYNTSAAIMALSVLAAQPSKRVETKPIDPDTATQEEIARYAAIFRKR